MSLLASQHPPPLQELYAQVNPQQPFGKLQAVLHSFNVSFFLFTTSIPRFFLKVQIISLW